MEEEIVTVFEDVPTTRPSATTSTPSTFHHPFKGPSTTVNLLDRPRIASVIDKMKTAFEGSSTPPSSSDKPETASTSTRAFEGPSALHYDEVIIETERRTAINLPRSPTTQVQPSTFLSNNSPSNSFTQRYFISFTK